MVISVCLIMKPFNSNELIQLKFIFIDKISKIFEISSSSIKKLALNFRKINVLE